jgi:hypothetical protein
MSDEYETPTESQPFFSLTVFWPLFIFLFGFFLWIGFEVYAAASQRSFDSQQFQKAIPYIQEAQQWQSRYNTLMQDLIQVAGKDAPAAAIAKEAVQAGVQTGLIHLNEQQGGSSTSTNSVGTPAAPDSSSK